jgi:hypothetical protein
VFSFFVSSSERFSSRFFSFLVLQNEKKAGSREGSRFAFLVAWLAGLASVSFWWLGWLAGWLHMFFGDVGL